MANIFDSIRKRFPTIEPLQPGMYHYISPPDDKLNFRLHLRIEDDGKGVLIVNAATVLHLNQTATEYAYHLLHETPTEDVVRNVVERYNIDKETVSSDYLDFKERIIQLISTPDLDPVTYLGLERKTPYSESISAPYRLDCALTYQLPPGSDPSLAPVKRVDRELSTEEWKMIIDKAWQNGIPHILFTGGEPTLRDDLANLIEHAEKNGQVTGICTNGLKLADAEYLNTLLQAGLDHALILLQPENEETWESLSSFSYWSEVLEEDIYVVAHVTLTKENAAEASRTINRIADSDVNAISLSINDPKLSRTLDVAREVADDLGMEIVWDLPVPYSKMNPLALELQREEQETPEGAGKGWLYVEPDGDILPAQGINIVLGNILTDSWKELWKKAQEL